MVAAMAIWQECDRCGTTTKDTRGDLWATATLSVVKARPISYDLCPACYQKVRASLVGNNELTSEQQTMLAQIWANAQHFDQSIGDIERP